MCVHILYVNIFTEMQLLPHLCNTRGCIANYHLMCAREDECVFIFCMSLFMSVSLQKCNYCQLAGATVGCNTRGCIANYHFMCASKDKCVFIFCMSISLQKCNYCQLAGVHIVYIIVYVNIFAEMQLLPAIWCYCRV